MKLRFFLVAASSCCLASAFAGKGFLPRNLHHLLDLRSVNHRLRAAAPEDGNGAGKELVSTLARIDETWQIQQRFRPQSRWKELSIDDSTVYLLEPPSSSIPSCLIVFYGGAGLGQFPHIAYNELLLRISNRLNAAILAAPYSISLDHFAVAKQVGELARKAVIQCEDERQYPTSLPTYCLSHSLGCKLATIYMAATDQEYEGIGFMSFNNFGFSRTISMARQFADAIGESMMSSASNPRQDSSTRQILDQVFEFAESAVSMIGLDFTPNPSEMERLIELKFDSERQKRTRLFTFDDDNLETTPEFIHACSGEGPSVSGLEGTHLTPVYFKLDLDQVDDIPPEAREMAREAMVGFKSVSFGNEEQLNALVNEIYDWILGKGPSRPPKWQRELPQIAAAPGSSSEEET